MKLTIMCVRDRATSQYGTPMFLVSVGQGIRSFSDEINRGEKDNQLFRHPEDFDLFLLGSFDTDKGLFTCDEGPSQVAIGKDLVISKG